ncbi:PD40 domain-containing protein [Vibrio vulnificus]|uniref:S41 family peptidase n=1 Tax=Vibrio vulnificus TaxID=672 RepID=UPI001028ABAB|nr:S41 family peptidase [Vibrio vulnificus]MCA3881955.1 PD40 domain-containing protein [Vibrio vulnificus]MCA3948227.1 PD40 domain-containing protein [Vibrio vulnificus]RZQ44941.1 protease [Vibrio vulnificus]HAS8151043.1 protease [Vibrio vulnificus]
MRIQRFTANSIALVLLASLSNPSLAQESVATTTTNSQPTWLRDIALSPDGQRIAFTYAGQIWLIASKGGEAIPLTSADSYSENPIWSPDGESIAFTTDRFGPGDVFLVSTNGGDAKRLTYHFSKDVPYAFSPNGQEIYFRSSRIGDIESSVNNGFAGSASAQIYSVDVSGGREKLLLANPISSLSINGQTGEYLYTDLPSPMEQEWRKRDVSDAARDIWRFDPKTAKHTKLTNYRGEDRNAVWAEDGRSMYYLSERSGSFNVWQRVLSDPSAEPVQITQHEFLPVRFLSISQQGDLAYGYDGDIWFKGKDEADAKPLQVTIRQSFLSKGKRFVNLNHEATEIAVSPVAPEVAIVARGDVYVVSLLSGATKRVTKTPQAERYLSFSNDGLSLLYASERNGNWDVFHSYINDTGRSFSTSFDVVEEQLSDEAVDQTQPLYSPDGTKIAYRENSNSIKVYDIKNDSYHVLLDSSQLYSYVDRDLSYEWSPDSQYLVTRNRASYNADIVLLKADGSEKPLQITNTGFIEGEPKFSHDGQMIYWSTDRNSLREIDKWAVQSDIYLTVLNQEADFNWKKDDEQRWLEEERAADSGEEPGEQAPQETVVESKGLKHRTYRVTPYSMTPIFSYLSPDNQSLLVANLVGDEVEFTDINTQTGETNVLFTRSSEDVAAVKMEPDIETLVIIGAHGIEELHLPSGEGNYVDYQADANYDFRAEVEYIFDHAWRQTDTRFYDKGMHGVDWQGYGEAYKRYLPGIHNYQDFAELLSEMSGELNASHTGASYGRYQSTWSEPASLGLFYDDQYRGKGVRVKAVIPGGPADIYQSPIKAGSIIYSVDGIEVAPEMDIYPLLDNKAGKRVRLSVLKPGDKAAQNVLLVPTSLEQEAQLAYELWVEQRKALTEERSQGRLGYIHIPEMGPASYETLVNELFGEYNDKEGVIIDIRYNMGGNLHDQLMETLSGTRHSAQVTRDGYQLSTFPERRWAKPSIMLANAASYSDGSIVPYFYQREGIGQLVGERVPGTGTAVLWEPQQEQSLVYGIPQLGFKDDQGRWFENQEVVPDVLVYNSPEDIANNYDRQLKVAIESLLAQLDKTQ